MSYVPAFPKPVRLEDPDYLRFIRRQGCLLHPQVAADAHHLEARGVGTKCSDYRTIPLCRIHHRELHHLGRRRFENVHSVDLPREQFRYLEIYISALKRGVDLGAK